MNEKKLYFIGSESNGKRLIKKLKMLTNCRNKGVLKGDIEKYVYFNFNNEIWQTPVEFLDFLIKAGYSELALPSENKGGFKYCNLYYNNNTRKYKTGEHRYNSIEEAMLNKADYPYYVYFDSIECSLNED